MDMLTNTSTRPGVAKRGDEVTFQASPQFVRCGGPSLRFVGMFVNTFAIEQIRGVYIYICVYIKKIIYIYIF